MPYQGSKNRIAENLVKHLPPAKHFYDLFGGGGAVSHCALLSGKYKVVHYNELDPLVFRGFQMFINGGFKTENRWISREDFSRLKDSDPYVAICFSFANNLKNYCYDEETEAFKKAVHYSICFNDNLKLNEYIDLSGFKYTKTDLKERRLELQTYFTYLFQKCYNPNLKNIEKFVSFNPTLSVKNISQNLERLDILNNFSSGNLILTNKSYSDVQIEPDSVIYCDPPYLETGQYKVEFDHNEFYEWLRHSKNRVFISEYQMPDDFFEVYSEGKIGKFKGSKKTIEKLFSNRPAENPLEF